MPKKLFEKGNRNWVKNPVFIKNIFKSGSSNPRKGKPLTEEHKKSLKSALRKKRNQFGDKNPCWRNGRSSLSQKIRRNYKYRLWKSDVLSRDEFTCQLCEHTENLEVDHVKSLATIIDEYKIKTIEEAIICEELWNINNGRTLCDVCHRKTPNYGNRNKC